MSSQYPRGVNAPASSARSWVYPYNGGQANPPPPPRMLWNDPPPSQYNEARRLPHPHPRPHDHGRSRLHVVNAAPESEVDEPMTVEIHHSDSGYQTEDTSQPVVPLYTRPDSPRKKSLMKKAFKGVGKLPSVVFGYGVGMGMTGKLKRKGTYTSTSGSHSDDPSPRYATNPSTPHSLSASQPLVPHHYNFRADTPMPEAIPEVPESDFQEAHTPPPDVVRLSDTIGAQVPRRSISNRGHRVAPPPSEFTADDMWHSEDNSALGRRNRLGLMNMNSAPQHPTPGPGTSASRFVEQAMGNSSDESASNINNGANIAERTTFMVYDRESHHPERASHYPQERGSQYFERDVVRDRHSIIPSPPPLSQIPLDPPSSLNMYTTQTGPLIHRQPSSGPLPSLSLVHEYPDEALSPPPTMPGSLPPHVPPPPPPPAPLPTTLPVHSTAPLQPLRPLSSGAPPLGVSLSQRSQLAPPAVTAVTAKAAPIDNSRIAPAAVALSRSLSGRKKENGKEKAAEKAKKRDISFNVNSASRPRSTLRRAPVPMQLVPGATPRPNASATPMPTPVVASPTTSPSEASTRVHGNVVHPLPPILPPETIPTVRREVQPREKVAEELDQDLVSPVSIHPEPSADYLKMTTSPPSTAHEHAEEHARSHNSQTRRDNGHAHGRSTITSDATTYSTSPSFSSQLNPVERFFKVLYNMPWVSRARVTVDYKPGEGVQSMGRAKVRGKSAKGASSTVRGVGGTNLAVSSKPTSKKSWYAGGFGRPVGGGRRGRISGSSGSATADLLSGGRRSRGYHRTGRSHYHPSEQDDERRRRHKPHAVVHGYGYPKDSRRRRRVRDTYRSDGSTSTDSETDYSLKSAAPMPVPAMFAGGYAFPSIPYAVYPSPPMGLPLPLSTPPPAAGDIASPQPAYSSPAGYTSFQPMMYIYQPQMPVNLGPGTGAPVVPNQNRVSLAGTHNPGPTVTLVSGQEIAG